MNISVEKDIIETLDTVTRVEVIDENGRSYVKYNADQVEYSIQDHGRTLKIFITKNPKENYTLI